MQVARTTTLRPDEPRCVRDPCAKPGTIEFAQTGCTPDVLVSYELSSQRGVPLQKTASHQQLWCEAVSFLLQRVELWRDLHSRIELRDPRIRLDSFQDLRPLVLREQRRAQHSVHPRQQRRHLVLAIIG